MIDAMGIDFGKTWGWGGWPLFYDQFGTCVASYSIDHTTIPIWWDGLLPGPRYGLPPGEAWDHRGMLMYFMFCDFDSIAYVLCMDR
jgi:hypothetical protein